MRKVLSMKMNTWSARKNSLLIGKYFIIIYYFHSLAKIMFLFVFPANMPILALQIYLNTKRHGNIQLRCVCCWHCKGMYHVCFTYKLCFRSLKALRNSFSFFLFEGCFGWCRFSSCSNGSLCAYGGSTTTSDNYFDKIFWRGKYMLSLIVTSSFDQRYSWTKHIETTFPFFPLINNLPLYLFL